MLSKIKQESEDLYDMSGTKFYCRASIDHESNCLIFNCNGCFKQEPDKIVSKPYEVKERIEWK